jgi:hypothetical protein
MVECTDQNEGKLDSTSDDEIITKKVVNKSATRIIHKKIHKNRQFDSESDDSEIITHLSSDEDDFEDDSFSDSDSNDLPQILPPPVLSLTNPSISSYKDVQNKDLATLRQWNRDQIHLPFDNPEQNC